MRAQEAIKNMYALNAVCGQKDFYDKEFETAINMAIESMKKDIPKKPKGISVNEDNMRVANCPNCGKFIVQKESPIGCKSCLQRLDWEEGGTSD